jgi:hypothetical protein
MFETASKMKLRFASDRGSLTTEDLWDLPLTANGGVSLDNIARALSRQLKAEEEESFVKPKTSTTSTLSLKLEIVKRVIEVKLAEIEDRELAAERKLKKERLLGVIAEKEDDKLKKTSLADLKKMVNEL